MILITFTDSKITETFLVSGTLFNQLDDDDDDDNDDDDKMKEKSKFLKRTWILDHLNTIQYHNQLLKNDHTEPNSKKTFTGIFTLSKVFFYL